MKPDQLMDALNGVDEELLERSEKKTARILPLRRFAILAACACIALVCVRLLPGMLAPGNTSTSMDSSLETSTYQADNDYEDSAAAIPIDVPSEFTWNETRYTYSQDPVNSEELGEELGTITDCSDERLNGTTAYQYENGIAVEYQDQYYYYTKE